MTASAKSASSRTTRTAAATALASASPLAGTVPEKKASLKAVDKVAPESATTTAATPSASETREASQASVDTSTRRFGNPETKSFVITARKPMSTCAKVALGVAGVMAVVCAGRLIVGDRAQAIADISEGAAEGAMRLAAVGSLGMGVLGGLDALDKAYSNGKQISQTPMTDVVVGIATGYFEGALVGAIAGGVVGGMSAGAFGALGKPSSYNVPSMEVIGG